MQELLSKVESEISKRNISEDKISEALKDLPQFTNRRIVGGYASVSVVDREGQRIGIQALKPALKQFMEDPHYRNVNVFHCLSPETPILIQNGNKGRKYIPISEVKIGDKVFTHKGKARKVLKTIVHDNNGPALRITLENGEIITITDEHPILTKRGWVKAGELSKEDILLKLEKHNPCKGKTWEEIVGNDRAKIIRFKISNNKTGKYALTEKHNSQQRKGKTWVEVYSHEKPYYGGSSGEKNPMFGKIGRITGDKNPNWKNGASKELYGDKFNYSLKELIRKSFGYCCFKCGISQNNLHEKLIIHHVDENKKNNSFYNLVSVCRKCHSKIHNESRMVLHNGTKIVSIENIWYTGKVYNLEVEIDHTYVGKGIIYHNSDVTVGRVLPKWTNPDTGEVFTTHVDDKGMWVVCEIRDDLEIADKVWDEIEKGNLRSFSIAGSSKKKEQKYSAGQSFEDVLRMEQYEITICLPPNEKIWTRKGLIPISEVKVGDYVLTHKTTKIVPSWKLVTKTMNRNVNEEICKISTNLGSLSATSEHPVRVLVYGGRHDGTHYDWKLIKDIKVGDKISYHSSFNKCLVCDAPLFSNQGKFCSLYCKYQMPNRKGSHYISKFRGITKKQNPKVIDTIKEFSGNKLSEVVKVERIRYSGKVYNLEVEEDNSYSTEFAVVHNCEVPVNQLSSFEMLWNPEKVEV